MNHFRRFQHGSEVSYVGNKFAKDLNGVMGVVDAFIGGTDHGVAVSFGKGPEDHYIMDERRDLAPWTARPKTEHHDKKDGKAPKVETRKGVGERGKRRVVDQGE